MVLDPLTALSLAGNILQFIDFAAKVVSKCRGIHKSPDGVLPEDQELELVASDLARLSKRLEEEHWPKRETADENPYMTSRMPQSRSRMNCSIE
jgi:hypothetical protein